MSDIVIGCAVTERDQRPWLGPFCKQLVPSLMEGLAEQCLYAAAERQLAPPAAGEKRAALLGNSIVDGVHPNAQGYAIMAPIARRAIAEALAASHD